MMLELLKNLLSPDRYMPHGQCYLWQTPLIGLHVVSDGLIAIAYFSIPAMLIYFIHKRKDIPFSNVFAMFGAFILLCGTGHLLDIWTLWHPAYWLSGGVRALTALVSCYTALQLVTLLPAFLALKTPDQLEAINQKLQTEIIERQRAEDTLRSIVTGTASVTGKDFFPALVKHLAIALNVPYVMVTELVEGQPDQLKTLAAWANQTLAENITTLSLPGNPCETVIQEGRLCHYPDTLQERFPTSPIAKDLQAESYIGVPLMSAKGHTIGNLCLLHTQPLAVDENKHAIVSVFAARAAAELERQWAEQARSRAYEALEFRVDERTAALLDINTALATEIQERIAADAELQRMAGRERATTHIIVRMRQSLALDDIFSTTTIELRQVMQCDRTLIYRFNPNWSGTVVAESVAAGWNAIVPIRVDDSELAKIAIEQPNCIVKRLDGTEALIQDTYLQASEGRLYRQANYCCVPDIHAAGFDACYLELLESLQARAYIIVPIFCGSQLWGLLAAYQNSAPRQWQEAEIRVASQISSQLGVAVQQAELFAQTQQQAEDLKQAKELADAANRAKSEFLANMSHELRTPLNAVLGFTQLMSCDSSLTHTHQEHLQIINRSGEHLLKLINDVLEMSKIEAGQIALDHDRFDLHNLLHNLEEMLRLRAETKQLQFTIICAEELPQFVIADESKLQQILINLLGNAIKFTRWGSVTLRVSRAAHTASNTQWQINQVSLLEQQMRLRFEVEDTGEGIALHEQQNLFKPFEQTRSSSVASEGTGLGLAISQKFVQLMGGKITITSQPNQGSLFSFDIPVSYTDVSAASRLQLITQTVIGVAPGQPTYRILIAEDNVANRYLLTQILRLPGFELKEADNGLEAIALCKQWQPHLIFMDMRMPVMDGVEATRQIKANAETRSTIVIALTASAFEEQRQAFLAVGCDDFLSKPFQRLTLLTKISQHLGVQYLYETSALAQAAQLRQHNQHTSHCSEADLDATLASLPEAWRTQLYRAALEGSDTRVFELLQQIPSEQMFLRDAITALAEGFQFDQILTLLSSPKPTVNEVDRP